MVYWQTSIKPPEWFSEKRLPFDSAKLFQQEKKNQTKKQSPLPGYLQGHQQVITVEKDIFGK